MSPTPRTPQFVDAIEKLPIAGALKRFIIPQKLNRIYPGDSGVVRPRDFAADVLRKLNVTYRVTDADLARIPKSGPVVVVSNHPFGILEGLILIEMLSRVRSDVKILGNSLLSSIPELRDGLILVDPFENSGSKNANRRGVRETLSYLANGGLLIVFPAGEVSHLQLRARRIADPGWNENIARFIRHSKATVCPIFIKGANSLAFQLIGMIHSQLRTARLLHELVNKEEKTIELRVAHPITAETLRGFPNDRDMTRYLRFRTYLLENRGKRAGPQLAGLLPPAIRPKRQQRIVEPRPAAAVEAEIARLVPLIESGDFAVYRAKAEAIPNVLHEIGRWREITFREVGEGTGRATDLDSFDQHYFHLFLWDLVAKQVVGAYRLGETSNIFPRLGLQGLYTSTLFHFDLKFFDRIGPAIEMGRSFVRTEYQKQYAPLLLLWKGIGAHVVEHRQHAVLFGPVSISNEYHPVSKRLIVRYLQAQESIKDLADLVKPRRKFRTRRRGSDNEAISLMLRDSQELSDVTADIEPDGKGIPILLKQYLKLGGKLLAFNVDPFFAHALDGLVLVDLRQTEPAILQRYLGRDGAARFLRYHQKEPAQHFTQAV